MPEEENPYVKTFIAISSKPSGSIDPNQNVKFSFSEPLASLDSTKLHFYMKQDTDWVPIPYLFIPEKNSSDHVLYAEWEPKQQYKFEADSAGLSFDPNTWT